MVSLEKYGRKVHVCKACTVHQSLRSVLPVKTKLLSVIAGKNKITISPVKTKLLSVADYNNT